MNLGHKLKSLRPAIATAAQKVVDEWQLDEDGLDPELGAGGICDRIADSILDTIYGHLDGVEAALGAPEGEDHQWVVASDGYLAFVIDIPSRAYETGGGYSWKKIEGAEISVQDVVIEPIDLELAQDLLKESGQMRRLTALAEALGALGEDNSATLVRVLTVPRIVHGAPEPETELAWPFPPPNVLQDMRVFIAAALAWSAGEGREAYGRMYGSPENLRDMGKKGEIQAARAYLRHLMKDVAPQLAATLQAKWRKTSEKGDMEAQRTLRAWWESLSDVWGLMQRIVGLVNSYEK